MSDDREKFVSKAELVKLSNRRGLKPLSDLEQSKPVDEIAMSTGWWEMDQLFKFYPGQFTVITGVPGSGKSTFALNMISNIAKKSGAHSFLYSPENEMHLREKMARIWGDDLGFDVFCREQCFVQSAMPQRYDDPAQTLDWILQQSIVAIEEDHVDVLLLDPWNEIEWAKRTDQIMTDYVAQCLKMIKFFARARHVSIIMVAHPTKHRVAGNGPPTLADIEGSAHWWNKCDNGLIVERDKQNGITKVTSAKVRERGAGKIGCCYFHFNEETEQYTPQLGAVNHAQ